MQPHICITKNNIMNTFLKGFFMSLVGFIATMLSGGETINFNYVLLATAGFTVIYLGKNYVLPSISAVGVDLRDMLSGLIIAVGMALSSAAAGALTDTFAWKAVGLAVLGAVVGYFAKTIPSKKT